MTEQKYDRDYQKRFNSRFSDIKPSVNSHLFYTGLYSSKDGEDIAMKTLGVTKNFFMMGVVTGMVNTKTKVIATQQRTFVRFFAAGLFPTMLYGAFFTMATQCVGLYRGKDGALNHFIGGIATAPLLSVFWKIPAQNLAPYILLGSLMAAYRKSIEVRGAYVVFNPYVFSPWKTTKERPRNNLRPE